MAPTWNSDHGQAKRRPSLVNRIDPGWLFVVLGLAVLAAGILMPSWRENKVLQQRLEQARSAESQARGHLGRSTSMLDQLRNDKSVGQRVVRADRNLLSPGDEPLLRDLEAPSDVLQWLDASTQQANQLERGNEADAIPVSRLEIMMMGSRRLWLLGAGAMCLCLGLVLGPSRGASIDATQDHALQG